jgi:hypothetical protein
MNIGLTNFDVKMTLGPMDELSDLRFTLLVCISALIHIRTRYNILHLDGQTHKRT